MPSYGIETSRDHKNTPRDDDNQQPDSPRRRAPHHGENEKARHCVESADTVVYASRDRAASVMKAEEAMCEARNDLRQAEDNHEQSDDRDVPWTSLSYEYWL